MITAEVAAAIREAAFKAARDAAAEHNVDITEAGADFNSGCLRINIIATASCRDTRHAALREPQPSSERLDPLQVVGPAPGTMHPVNQPSSEASAPQTEETEHDGRLLFVRDGERKPMPLSDVDARGYRHMLHVCCDCGAVHNIAFKDDHIVADRAITSEADALRLKIKSADPSSFPLLEPREPHAALVKEIDALIAIMRKDAEAHDAEAQRHRLGGVFDGKRDEVLAQVHRYWADKLAALITKGDQT